MYWVFMRVSPFSLRALVAKQQTTVEVEDEEEEAKTLSCHALS